MIAPCRDCPEKGCGAKHDTCEAFREYREKKDAMAANRVKERLITDTIIEGIERVHKTRKPKGRI